jgi:hypothetical protein
MTEYHGSSFVDFFAPKIRARKGAKKTKSSCLGFLKILTK